jgi:hypothetical protein
MKRTVQRLGECVSATHVHHMMHPVAVRRESTRAPVPTPPKREVRRQPSARLPGCRWWHW